MKSAPSPSLSLSLCGLLLLAHSVSAQGPLVPPGPPGPPLPMMKTLQEMEPRTHIAAAGYVITAPGSYYLTGNLNGGGTQNGITVQASGVTIDLRGFSIENCQVGISAVSGVRTVAVANGSVRNCIAAGVDLSAAELCRLEGVIVSANAGDGANVGAGSLMTLCTASGNGGRGLLLGDNGTVFRCVVQNNANSGIVIASNCQATENTCTANGSGTGQAGLVTVGANNRVEGNSANSNNGRGFAINGTGNLVVRNNACGNTLGDYIIVAGNNYGQILLSPGAGFVNSNAWANFGCGTQPGVCVVDSDCDDGNNCTADICGAGGVCNSYPISGCGGLCEVAADCEDGNECTTDICQAGACVYDPIPGCGAPVCGDGIIDAGEGCDDGNFNNGDGCSDTCQIEIAPVCGNGVVDAGEGCDDGNLNNGDGCSYFCQIEEGGVCTDGSTQPCYSGPPGTAGVGACQIGIRICNGGTWSPCLSQTLPSVEVCGDGIDNNCDGRVDENCDCPDNDLDGFTICDGDCDDSNYNINPGQAEVCDDGLDNDCDGLVNGGCPGNECGFFNGMDQGTCGAGFQCINGFCVFCPDNDEDGVTTCDGDCNDANPAVKPGVFELCGDGIDNDCDGQIDEWCGAECGIFNGSIQGTCAAGLQCFNFSCVQCTDNDQDGVTNCDGDCNDNDPAINPTIVEICDDGIDNNCDGLVDVGGVCNPNCGNGLIDAGETCDDGNLIDGDGCSATCQVEP